MQLFEGFRVHEMPAVFVFVEVLHFGFVHVGRFNAVAGFEGTLNDAAGFEVAHFDAVEGLSFAGFDEFVFDDVVRVAVQHDFQASLEFVG